MNKFDFKRAETLASALSVVDQKRGTCLDATFSGSGQKILIRCEKGHEWRASPYTLIEGDWCFDCAREEAAQKTRAKTYQAFTDYIAAQGGKVLSPAYEFRNQKLLAVCARGHEWEIAPTEALERRATCPRCREEKEEEIKRHKEEQKLKDKEARREEVATDAREKYGHLKALVEATGCTLLDPFTGGVPERLRVHCRRHNHTALMRVARIRQGLWCPRCGHEKAAEAKRQRTYQRACQVARERGGDVVSPSYGTEGAKLTWKCDKGHEWEASPAAVLGKRATWCPHPDCLNTDPTTMTTKERQARAVAVRMAHSLRTAKEVAQKVNGKCLSETYERECDGLQFQCSRGHVFTMRYKALKQLHWCDQCAKTRHSNGETLTRAILEQLMGVPLPLAYPAWLRSPSSGEQLSLDMYNAERKVAFEYHGEGVHYNFRETGRYSDLKKFKRTQEIDKEKVILCAQSGVLLVVIRGFDYYISTKQIIERMRQILRDFSLPFDEAKKVVVNHDDLFFDDLLDRVKACVSAKGGVLHSPIIPGMLHKIEVECCTHHRIWTTTASGLLNQGKWCQECATERTGGALRLTKEEIQRRVDAVPRKYRITLASVGGKHPHLDYATWNCERHGAFQRNVDSLIYPQHGRTLGCPACDEEEFPSRFRRLGKRKKSA